MSGFHTLAAPRPTFDYGRKPGRLPPPVVPMDRCRPVPVVEPKIPALKLPPIPVEAVPERQAEPRAPLGLAPVMNAVPGASDALHPVAPIVRLVADLTGVPVGHIKGVSRQARVVRARQIACFVAKRFTGRSLPQIGRALGDRDHTTVLHSIRRAESAFAGKPRPAEDTAEAWTLHLWGMEWPKAK